MNRPRAEAAAEQELSAALARRPRGGRAVPGRPRLASPQQGGGSLSRRRRRAPAAGDARVSAGRAPAPSRQLRAGPLGVLAAGRLRFDLAAAAAAAVV